MELKVENLYKEIFLVSNESELSQIRVKLNELEKTLDDSPNNLIKKSIIDFMLAINPLLPEWKEQEKIDISKDLISLYYEKDINKLIEKKFELIKNPLLKYLIEIDEVLPKEKDNIKLCLKLILLSQNKEIILNYIKNLSSASIDINYIEKEISNLNFKNPFAIIFIHNIIKIICNMKKENIKDIIDENMKDLQIFRCSKCFDLLYVCHNENGTSLICNNKLHSIENSKNLKKLKYFDLICCECKMKMKIYYNNYKCIKCKGFICHICSENHYNNCSQSELINLFDVGYFCEIHNRKYIDSCDLCNKNLCTECKIYHFHIIKKENHIEVDEKITLNSIKLNKLGKTQNYIKYYLFKRYRYMKKFNLINMKINKSLHFMIYKGTIHYDLHSFFSSKFFDDKFKEYYKFLLEESKKGKIKEFEGIRHLEKEYKVVGLFSQNEEYNNFIELCLKNQIKRNGNLIDNCNLIWNLLLSIQQSFDNIRIFKTQKKINDNNININLLKSKIIKLDKTNHIDQIFIKKILTRYFSDYIIKLLIKKFPLKFRSIDLSLNNIYEIITTYGADIIKENEVKLIKDFIEKLISQNNNFNKEKYLIDYINKMKENNKILFKESITINHILITKEELNFILGALFYLKRSGNIVAHPNIESEIGAEINEISKKVKTIKDLIESNIIISNNPNDKTTLIDITLKKEVKEILYKFEDEILEDFKEISFNRNSELEAILNYMFKNDFQNIITKGNAFLRVIKGEMENIINDEKDFDENNLMNIINNEDMIDPKEILNKLDKYEKLIKDKIAFMESFNIEKNKGFERIIKSEVKNINLLDFSTFPILTTKYSQMLEQHLTDSEIKAYIVSILAKEYVENKDFIKKKNDLKMKLREFIKYEIIKIKLEKLYELVEKNFDKKISDFNETLFIDNVKKFIKEQNFEGSEKIIEKNLSFKKIMDILKVLLVNEKNIDWLVLTPEESTSISSYLYYMQNKKP